MSDDLEEFDAAFRSGRGTTFAFSLKDVYPKGLLWSKVRVTAQINGVPLDVVAWLGTEEAGQGDQYLSFVPQGNA